MSEAAMLNMDEQWQKMTMAWTAAGHEVIHDRMTFRHKAFKKDLPPETVVKMNGVPYIVPGTGKTLTVGDMLPERADLCLDMDGNLISQRDFEARWKDFSRYFPLIEGSDPHSEYIPNVEWYATQIPDEFSESPGTVSVGFDARKPAPDERTHLYDPINDKMVEILEKQDEKTELLMDAVKTLLEEKKNRRGPGRPRKVAQPIEEGDAA